MKTIEMYYDGKRLSSYSKEEIMEFFIETSDALAKAKTELRENSRKQMGMKTTQPSK